MLNPTTKRPKYLYTDKLFVIFPGRVIRNTRGTYLPVSGTLDDLIKAVMKNYAISPLNFGSIDDDPLCWFAFAEWELLHNKDDLLELSEKSVFRFDLVYCGPERNLEKAFRKLGVPQGARSWYFKDTEKSMEEFAKKVVQKNPVEHHPQKEARLEHEKVSRVFDSKVESFLPPLQRLHIYADPVEDSKKKKRKSKNLYDFKYRPHRESVEQWDPDVHKQLQAFDKLLEYWVTGSKFIKYRGLLFEKRQVGWVFIDPKVFEKVINNGYEAVQHLHKALNDNPYFAFSAKEAPRKSTIAYIKCRANDCRFKVKFKKSWASSIWYPIHIERPDHRVESHDFIPAVQEFKDLVDSIEGNLAKKNRRKVDFVEEPRRRGGSPRLGLVEGEPGPGSKKRVRKLAEKSPFRSQESDSSEQLESLKKRRKFEHDSEKLVTQQRKALPQLPPSQEQPGIKGLSSLKRKMIRPNHYTKTIPANQFKIKSQPEEAKSPGSILPQLQLAQQKPKPRQQQPVLAITNPSLQAERQAHVDYLRRVRGEKLQPITKYGLFEFKKMTSYSNFKTAWFFYDQRPFDILLNGQKEVFDLMKDLNDIPDAEYELRQPNNPLVKTIVCSKTMKKAKTVCRFEVKIKYVNRVWCIDNIFCPWHRASLHRYDGEFKNLQKFTR